MGESVKASCDICSVSFINDEQLHKHILYHQTDEFYNHWLSLYKKLPSYEEDNENLEPIEILEPSENNKYKPNDENSVPKPPKNQTLDKVYEISNDKKYPTCKSCGKDFVHINTLKIHEKKHLPGYVPPPTKVVDR